VIAGLAYVVTTFLAFPHLLGERVVDVGVVFAWLAPACLLLCLSGATPRQAVRRGLLAGWLAHAAVLHWIYVVTVVYGRAPAIVGVVAVLLLGAFVALFSGLFAGGAAWLSRHSLASPLALAALWTAVDHLRSFAFTGFPWATLGYGQIGNPVLVGLAPTTGVYGLSFVSVLGAALAVALVQARGQGGSFAAGRRDLVAGGLVLIAALGWGAAEMLRDRPEPANQVRVAVVQGNIEQGVKWSADWLGRTVGIYEELTERAAEAGAEIVVWPETAVAGTLDLDPELRDRVTGLARRVGVVLVVGGVGLELEDGAPAQTPRLFDSAFLIDSSGQPLERYDKSHLVPFGEYVPLRWLIGAFVRAVATGSAGRDVSAGAGPRGVFLPGVSSEPFVTAGVPICYELLFPDLVRRFVGDGAQLLLGMTNDAWYGRTGAPFQFLAMTAMRSAETGVWTARAANTGVSALIDDRGRVRERTRIFERDFRVGDVPLHPPKQDPTFYVRFGDVFAKVCWMGVSALALLGARRSRGSRRGR